jgi:predicted phosphodiesterase
MNKSEIIKKYLDKYPNLPNKTIAKLIYKENKLLFKNIESIRSLIRYYKGSYGIKNLKELKTTKYLSEEKYNMKYNLPESIRQEYTPYKIIANKVLIFGDVHIPFHNIQAIETMFNYSKKLNIDAIIILGDLMDCFELSYFDKEPNVIRFNDERKYTKQFLQELKKVFPKAKIYYKFGNHEKRFEKYLISKAPEIYDCEEFRLEILLDLFNLGIKYIEEDRYINLNSELKLLHMHEYKKAVTSPANPARTTFLRTKSNALSAHHHQSSHHSEPKINGELISCWSIGCLCGLNPKYMPLNKWNHGFAIYTKYEDKFWNVENKMIIKDRVV